MGEPARGYSWPPFQTGNQVGEKFETGNGAAERHGAYSDRKVRPLADRITAELADLAPWTTRHTFAGTVASWARTEAQIALVVDYLDEHGILDSDGEPRPATKLLDRLEGRATTLRDRLGLSPLALAKLLGAVGAADHPEIEGELEALRVEGRALVEARAALDEGSDDE